jgi:5-methyltetrahydropteroyltriglutamate--homocysteine methyltransferase
MMLGSSAGARRVEAANPRHEHEWEDLGKLKIPDDKVLIPGAARRGEAGGGLR